MTTYRYDISLNDSELIALESALKLYLQYCREQLSEGAVAPYVAHKGSIESIQSKLYKNTAQMSGYDPKTKTIFIKT